MFDYIRCKYATPIDGAPYIEFQTKDTPQQYMDNYEIKEDGSLWHEDYDIEDHSKWAKWKKEHPGQEPPKELDTLEGRFIGCMSRVRRRWEKSNFTGEIRFYASLGPNHTGWIEFSSYFKDGQLRELNLLEHTP
jgi:hypothetical protein